VVEGRVASFILLVMTAVAVYLSVQRPGQVYSRNFVKSPRLTL
jgi:hypothetical protein